MGNVFNGATEDLLLYRVLPACFAILVFLLGAALTHLRRLLREKESSWVGSFVSQPGLYRTAATRQVGAPSSVRTLAYGLVAWSFVAGTAMAASALLGSMASQVAGVAMLSVFGFAAGIHALSTSFALCDRDDERVSKRLPATRQWVLLVHGIWLAVGTLGFGLLMLSTLFFWNAADGQALEVVEVCVAYAVVVLLPTALAYGLHRALRNVAPLYVSASKESSARAS